MNLEDYLESEGVIAGNSDGDVRVWEVLDSEAAEAIGVTVRDGRVIMAYPVDAVSQVGDGGSLADDADWQRTMELLPDGKTFIGFVSLARASSRNSTRATTRTPSRNRPTAR